MKANDFKSVVNCVANFFDIVAECKNIRANKFGYGFIAKSEVRVSSPKKTANEWLAKFGYPMEVKKVTCVTNARAYDYQEKVNKMLAKKGMEKNFVSESMNGYHWIDGCEGIIKESDKGSVQLCITFQKNDRTKFSHRYIVNGNRFANAEEEEFIKAHLYVAKPSAKQTESGIVDEDAIMVRNYKFANILAVGKSQEINNIWNELSK